MKYSPNLRGMGEKMINLPELIKQCSKNSEIENLLRSIQTNSSLSYAKSAFMNLKLTDDMINSIDDQITFQSPFEKVYIIMKLLRKERPFIEPVFFDFLNIWAIYKQIVMNDAYNSLNANEWINFIE